MITNNIVKVFFLRSGTRQGCQLSPLLFNIVFEVLVKVVTYDKEMEGIQIGKEEEKPSLFADDMIYRCPKDFTPKLLKSIKEFSKSCKV